MAGLTCCYCNSLHRRPTLMAAQDRVGGAADDASGRRKLRAEAHKIGVNVTRCLSAFIDTPNKY